MNIPSRMALVACFGIALAACAPKPQLTAQEVQSVGGLSMEAVEAKLGSPHVITNAGDSVWWDYDNIVMPDGKSKSSCQIVFKKGTVDSIKC